MNSKTLAIGMIAITVLMLAVSSLVSSEAMALRNGGSQTTDTCVHNGNGDTSDGACSGKGKSSNTVEQTTYKCQGKFQSDPC